MVDWKQETSTQYLPQLSKTGLAKIAQHKLPLTHLCLVNMKQALGIEKLPLYIQCSEILVAWNEHP